MLSQTWIFASKSFKTVKKVHVTLCLASLPQSVTNYVNGPLPTLHLLNSHETWKNTDFCRHKLLEVSSFEVSYIVWMKSNIKVIMFAVGPLCVSDDSDSPIFNEIEYPSCSKNNNQPFFRQFVMVAFIMPYFC